MPTVLQLSDTHLRQGDDGPTRRVRATLRTVAATGLAPDLVLLTGDLADDASVESCERLAALVSTFGAPVLAVAGNHDDPTAVATVFGPPTPVEVGDGRIVPLETTVAGQVPGAVDAGVAATLLDAGPDRPTLVAMHHPPHGPGHHPEFVLAGAEALCGVLAARPQVQAVASGHLHQAFDQTERGVRVVGAPSTWYAIRHEGIDFSADPAGVVGATVWRLGADGTWSYAFVGSTGG